MATHGPIPKPEDQLARSRERKGGAAITPSITVGERREVSWDLPASEEWPEVVQKLYEAASRSGQSDFYQDTDWAMLYIACDVLRDYYLKKRAMTLAEANKMLASLLISEGERRRVRVELRTPVPETEDATITAINNYKARLSERKSDA